MSPTPAELGGVSRDKTYNREISIVDAGGLLGRGLIEVTEEDPRLIGKTVFWEGLLIDAAGLNLCVHPLVYVQQLAPQPLVTTWRLFFEDKKPTGVGHFVLGGQNFGTRFHSNLNEPKKAREGEKDLTVAWEGFVEHYQELRPWETLRRRDGQYAFQRGFVMFGRAFIVYNGDRDLTTQGLRKQQLIKFLTERMRPVGENSFSKDQDKTIISRHITPQDLLLGIKNSMLRTR